MARANGTKVDSTMFYYYEYTGDTKTAETAIPTLYHSYNSGAAQPLFVSEAVAKADSVHVMFPGATAKTVLPAIAAAKAGQKNTAVFALPADRFDETVISWNNSKVNKFTLKVELVKWNMRANYSTADALVKKAAANYLRLPAVCNPYNVVFETPKAIASFEVVGTNEAYEFKHGEICSISLAKHIKVTDLFGKQVNNPYGVWDQVWSKYAWDKYGDGTNVNNLTVTEPTPTADNYGKYDTLWDTHSFFKAYGQDITFVELVDNKGVTKTGVMVENNNDLKLDPATTAVYDAEGNLTVADGYDYAFDANRGIIAINSKLANISRETTITVRVKFTHMHDGFEPIYENVNVKVVNAQ